MVDHSKRSSSGRVSQRSRTAAAKKVSLGGQVRVIAGHWRGRKLPVVQADGLRPTGDRVRETLFNWLQMSVPGSHCLDLFAGSGSLGLEAASRGAASVTLVESAAPVAAQLRQTLVALGAGDQVMVCEMSAEQFLATQPQAFDLVFIDPPFDARLHDVMIGKLVPAFLKCDALVYMELPKRESDLIQHLPASLSIVKEKRFGDVMVFLLRYEG